MPSVKRPYFGAKKVSKRFKGQATLGRRRLTQEEGPTQVSLNPQDQAGREASSMTLDDDLGSVGSVGDSSVQAGHGSEPVRDRTSYGEKFSG